MVRVRHLIAADADAVQERALVVGGRHFDEIDCCICEKGRFLYGKKWVVFGRKILNDESCKRKG